MEFEELQKIWNKQKKKDMFTINESVFDQLTSNKLKQSKRSINKQELGTLIVSPLIALYLAFGLSQDIYTYIISGIMILWTAYTLYYRLNRKRIINDFDQSALGNINAALANLQFQRNLEKQMYLSNFMIVIPGIVALYSRGQIWNPFFWGLVVVIFGIASGRFFYDIKRKHIPRKKELEFIKQKLLEEMQSSQ